MPARCMMPFGSPSTQRGGNVWWRTELAVFSLKFAPPPPLCRGRERDGGRRSDGSDAATDRSSTTGGDTRPRGGRSQQNLLPFSPNSSPKPPLTLSPPARPPAFAVLVYFVVRRRQHAGACDRRGRRPQRACPLVLLPQSSAGGRTPPVYL